MRRVARFLFGDNSLNPLFRKNDGGPLEPTGESVKINKQFLIIKDLYENLRSDIGRGQHSSKPKVHLGTPQTIGLRLFSSIFSNWKRLFGAQTELEVMIANSRELIPRLDAGLLDAVISYSQQELSSGIEEGTKAVTFKSFGYNSHMVLLCHPEAELWTNDGLDANRKVRKKRGRPQKTPLYDTLNELALTDLDFHKNRLIVVPSWRQPSALRDVVKGLDANQMREVGSYDEALTLARMGLGVTVASEIFAHRGRIAAFRLTPKESFGRWIGTTTTREKGSIQKPVAW